MGTGGWEMEKNSEGVKGDRGRGCCVFSWSTSSLMLALICLGWKLSTRLEYRWRFLHHPSFFTSPPQAQVSCLHSVCATDFLPPLPLAAALLRPKFCILSDPSLHLTSPSLSCSSVYHLHYPALFLIPLAYFNLPSDKFLLSSRLSHQLFLIELLSAVLLGWSAPRHYSVSLFSPSPDLCGTQCWWAVKSRGVCFCVFLWHERLIWFCRGSYTARCSAV